MSTRGEGVFIMFELIYSKFSLLTLRQGVHKQQPPPSEETHEAERLHRAGKLASAQRTAFSILRISIQEAKA